MIKKCRDTLAPKRQRAEKMVLVDLQGLTFGGTRFGDTRAQLILPPQITHMVHCVAPDGTTHVLELMHVAQLGFPDDAKVGVEIANARFVQEDGFRIQPIERIGESKTRKEILQVAQTKDGCMFGKSLE